MWRHNLSKANNEKGVISIYLCLILAVLIPVLLVIINAVRFKDMEVKIESVTNLASDAIMAEYHRDLLDKYGLLFVDTAYDKQFGSIENVENHFKEYADYNLNENKGLLLFGVKDMDGLSLTDAKITEVSRATDNNGQVFRYMAVSSMLDKYGYSYIDSVKDLISTYDSAGLDQINIITDSEKADAAVDSYIPPETEGVDWTDMSKEQPAPQVAALKKMDILSVVSDRPISAKTIDPSTYASKRSLISGNGKWKEWDNRNSVADFLLFNEYILQNLSNYRSESESGRLSYETEYVITGKNSDRDNLKGVVIRLLIVRGAANTLYFFTDEEKTAITKELAEALAAVCLCPPISIVFEVVFDVAWIYAESLYDVRKLLHGKSEPLITTKETWDLSAEKALDNTIETFNETIIDDKKDQSPENKKPEERKGLFYEDYLRLLLYLTNNDSKTMRTMDVVEMNVRSDTKREGFRLDDCIAAFTIQTKFKSDYGYEFLYTKEFGYQ